VQSIERNGLSGHRFTVEVKKLQLVQCSTEDWKAEKEVGGRREARAAGRMWRGRRVTKKGCEIKRRSRLKPPPGQGI